MLNAPSPQWLDILTLVLSQEKAQQELPLCVSNYESLRENGNSPSAPGFPEYIIIQKKKFKEIRIIFDLSHSEENVHTSKCASSIRW
jgi:hypothetical protein